MKFFEKVEIKMEIEVEKVLNKIDALDTKPDKKEATKAQLMQIPLSPSPKKSTQKSSPTKNVSSFTGK